MKTAKLVLLMMLCLLLAQPVLENGCFAKAVNAVKKVGWEPSQQTTLNDLPQALKYQVSASMGKNQPDYHAKKQGDGYLADNPNQDYLVQFNEQGMILNAGGARLGFILSGVGYGDLSSPAVAATPIAKDNRIEYQRGNVTEWYVNGPLGLQQGFTLQERPEISSTSALRELRLELTVTDGWQADLANSEQDLKLIAEDGFSLNYSGLIAYDANNKELPARFTINQNSDIVHILVDDFGANYPITIDPFIQQAYLKASNAEASDYFGRSVAISGDYAVVGAYKEDSDGSSEGDNSALSAGAAYVFNRSGTTWTQQAYLKASNAEVNDWFGYSVAISGDYAVVSTYREDSDGSSEGDNSALSAGAAYVFNRSGTTWTQQAYLKASNAEVNDWFGISVAISGDYALVSAYKEDSNGTGGETDNSAGGAGAAYVFNRSGTTWTQQAYLKASNAEADDYFGISVAISGDYALVGADREASNGTGGETDNSAGDAGAAYVFNRSGTTWTQQAYLKASNAEASDGFGYSVAISGDYAVVSAYNEGSDGSSEGDNSALPAAGAAYVFNRSGTTWTQQAYLKASNAEVNDWFGNSVAISGDYAVVSAYLEDSNGADGEGDNSASGAGAAYMFFNGTPPTLPEIDVQRPAGTSIPDGGTDDVGNQSVGTVNLTYTIDNSAGTAQLDVTAATASNLSNCRNFTVVTTLPLNIAAAGTATLEVSFAVDATGAFSFDMDIANNDGDENPYTFAIQGTGTEAVAPEIDVLGSSISIADGDDHTATQDDTDFGNADVTSDAVDHTFTIKNTGTANLNLTGTSKVVIGGTHAGDFSVTLQPTSPVSSGGGTTTFTVRFNPSALGLRTATISIDNDDADENPYTFAIQGTGTEKDSDGDGIPDSQENDCEPQPCDRDGDGILDSEDYDPAGWIYDETNGNIISGGTITVTPSTGVNIIENGSNGYYQFTVSQSGDYTLSYSPPSGFNLSSICTAQSTRLDIEPTDPNPYVVGDGSKDGANNQMTNWVCGDNPYYWEFHLEIGDPIIINNNIPLESHSTNIVLSAFYAEVGQDGIIINWTTETEPNNAGFNIFRSDAENGSYNKVNETLIKALGNTTTGASYNFVDKPGQAGNYYYKLQSVSLDGSTGFNGPIFVGLTSVDLKKYAVPDKYSLSQNYPNPFNPETTIEYALPKSGFVEITIFDTNGKLVRQLVSGQQQVGNHWVKWNGRNDSGTQVSSGVYFAKMKAGAFRQTNKMILMK